MQKDWKGNTHSVMVTLGASSHARNERQSEDYYATEPKAIELLLEQESFENVWECACGEGHLAKVLEEKGLLGKATDLVDRGYGTIENFRLSQEKWSGDIITNPPYKYATVFVRKAIELSKNKVAMFLRIQFLESKERRELFEEYPPHTVYVASSRLACAMNGDFEKMKGNAACYAWFVWQKGFKGNPTIKWIN